MRAQDAQALGECVVVRHQHATFAGGHILVREETEASNLAPGSQPASLQL